MGIDVLQVVFIVLLIVFTLLMYWMGYTDGRNAAQDDERARYMEARRYLAAQEGRRKVAANEPTTILEDHGLPLISVGVNRPYPAAMLNALYGKSHPFLKSRGGEWCALCGKDSHTEGMEP